MMIGDGLSGPEATDRLLKEWMPSSEKDPDAAAIVGVIACLQQLRITQPDELEDGLVGSDLRPYFSFAYSALASFRTGMSGSASFQRAKKSW
jgi:hypothetical protein